MTKHERHTPERRVRLIEYANDLFGSQFHEENGEKLWDVITDPKGFDLKLGTVLVKGSIIVMFDADSGHFPDPGFREIYHVAHPTTKGIREVTGFSNNYCIQNKEDFDFMYDDWRDGSYVADIPGKTVFWF